MTRAHCHVSHSIDISTSMTNYTVLLLPYVYTDALHAAVGQQVELELLNVAVVQGIRHFLFF